jgi:hypothetical protein
MHIEKETWIDLGAVGEEKIVISGHVIAYPGEELYEYECTLTSVVWLAHNVNLLPRLCRDIRRDYEQQLIDLFAESSQEAKAVFGRCEVAA